MPFIFKEYRTVILGEPSTKSKYGQYQNYTEEFDFGHFYKPIGWLKSYNRKFVCRQFTKIKFKVKNHVRIR